MKFDLSIINMMAVYPCDIINTDDYLDSYINRTENKKTWNKNDKQKVLCNYSFVDCVKRDQWIRTF